jgi:hypothetical protein
MDALTILEGDLLHTPRFFSGQLLQARQQLGANAGRLAWKIHQETSPIFKDVKAEPVAAMERDQSAVKGLNAPPVVFLVPRGTQQDRYLLWRMIGVPISPGKRHIQ